MNQYQNNEVPMPRPARPEKEVYQVKEKILKEALTILIDEGYDNLSMGKIGKHMGMTAANIYNYYQNKDELYNAIIIHGYNLLYDTLEKAIEKAPDKFERTMALLRSYLNFGITNPHYYHLMFSMIAPKYQDYIGTPMEATAFTEKQNSLRVFGLAVSIVEEYTKDHPGYQGVDGKIMAIQLWSQLHGIISLHNSGNLMEADEKPDFIIQEILANLEITIKRGVK